MASGEAHPKRFAMPSFWDCRPLGTTSTASMVSDGSDPPTGSVPPVGATGGAQQRVLSFVDGMLSPFRACVQPPLQSCVTLRPGDAKESSREDPLGYLLRKRWNISDEPYPSILRLRRFRCTPIRMDRLRLLPVI